jgi:hypothetical protein
MTTTDLDRQVAKLRRVDMCLRWLLVLFLWMTLGAWSCWDMRESLSQLSEYISMTGLRYSLFFHLWGGGAGLIICVSLTLSSLFWQIGQSLWKISDRERQHLETRVQKIQNIGTKHLFWRWIQ